MISQDQKDRQNQQNGSGQIQGSASYQSQSAILSKQTTVTGGVGNPRSRKSSQPAVKDAPAASSKALGSTNKKPKKNSSIEPPMIINQQQQQTVNATNLQSQMLAVNLRKKGMAPGKKMGVSRIRINAVNQGQSDEQLAQQPQQPCSAVPISHQKDKKFAVDPSKPMGSLFQSQKDEEDKCPQIQANDVVFNCNHSTIVHTRGSGTKKGNLPVSQDLLRSPREAEEGEQTRDRMRSEGATGKLKKSSQLMSNSGTRVPQSNSNSKTIEEPKIIKQKTITTALRIKNPKKTSEKQKEDNAITGVGAQPLTPTDCNSKNKRQSYPINLTKINSPPQNLIDCQKNKDFLSSIELKTPRVVNSKKGEDDEMQLEIDDDSQQSRSKSPANSSGSSSNEQAASDDSDEEDEVDLQKQKKLEQEKEQEMRKFAEQNGFKIQDEKRNRDDNIMELYEKAKNFVVTKEMLDEQQKVDEQNLIKRLRIPPALELLKKKYTNKEPVRTGFNEGLLPIQVKNNFEIKRYPQGPQIVITTMSQTFMERQRKLREQSIGSRERSSRKSFRSMSREKSDYESRQLQRGNSNIRQTEKFSQNNSAMKPIAGATEQDDDQVQYKEIMQVNSYNSEVSLRHLFYLEYKKKFPEGQTNPIVYSRFGKQNYTSEEQFDPDNFNQLIRTCNIKKILKLQDCQNLIFKKERCKFREPVSFPSCDYYTPSCQNDKTLVFESRFESGNLQLARKVSDNEYDLVLQNDINSKGHTQWFYFRVTNVKKGLKVKFNMLNMIKSKSLYNDGMKVLIYSEKKQQQVADLEGGVEVEGGWQRGGDDIGYYQNNYKKEHITNFQRYYYTFTFTHTFEFDNDQVFFAYSLPYTYSDLTNYLCEIEAKHLNYVTRNTLCRTIAGNKCEYLTITNRMPFEKDKKKEAVVFTGRIHPGESNSSLMMKGIIDFLISSDPKANELREKFVFKIVPMLNPDGVINGNYRCSLAGCDLNRRWKYPSEILHPTIYHTKKLIARLASERHLALYCDLHGHSRRKNVFFYGNNHEDNQNATRIFPFLMSKVAQPHFSYDYSKFSYCRTKEQTGRIAMWRELGSKNPNIFTLEASFCGPKSVKFEPHRGNKRAPPHSELNYHFTTKDLTDIGSSVCETILLYKSEKESTMGFTNIEYMIEQYHIDKEAKMEQEELIRQQQAIIDQRKANELLNKRANADPNAPNIFTSFLEDREALGSLGGLHSTASKKESAGIASTQNLGQAANNSEKKEVISKSVRKMVKKAKTESVAAAVDEVAKLDIFGTEKKVEGKSKVKYNLRDRADSSDAQSDSEPSEDNLEEDQIGKLIPKKWNKKRYLKGIDEKKKKPQPKPETPKKVEKKPKTMLMPCMSHKKNDGAEKEKKRDNSESVVKKIRFIQNSISKTIASRFRNGAYVRDIATQIKYKGDGRNLSLMELDILYTTGAKWSRILWPGYKGPRVQETDRVNELKIEEQNNCSSFVNDTSMTNLRTPVSKFKGEANQLSNSFSEQLRQEPGTKLKKIRAFNLQNQEKSVLTNEIIKQSMEDEASQLNHSNYKEGQFMNERRSSQGRNIKMPATQQTEQNQIDKLKKRIQEGNYSEPKSLFKGMDPCSNNSQIKNKLRQYAFDYGQKKILSEHKNYGGKIDISANNLYDLSLETVQEKVQEKTCMTLDVSDLMVKGKTGELTIANYNKAFNTKKIVNGEVVSQQSSKYQQYPAGVVSAPFDQPGNAHTLNLQGNKSNILNKLDCVISEGLRVRNNNIAFGSQNLNASNSSKNHHSISSNSRQCKFSQDGSLASMQGKLSFSNVAQQILSNNSSCDKQKKQPPSNVYDDLQHSAGPSGHSQIQMIPPQQAKSLVGRSINVNFANYKSVQQNGKQRRGSMLKEQIFQNKELSHDHLLNGSSLSIGPSGAIDATPLQGIGCHLVANPMVSCCGGGSISQLSAGVSIKNYMEEAPRKNFFQKQPQIGGGGADMKFNYK